MKILCGTDFSEPAGAALEVAAELASRFGDTLALAHVFSPPVAASAVMDATTAVALERSLREGIQCTLDSLVEPLREAGLAVETITADGATPSVLADLAVDIDARMIVVGSHGNSPTDHLLVGSVADRLVERTTLPVTVVRGERDGFSAWSRDERPLRLVVGVDLSRATDDLLAWVREMRSAGPCDVTFVHLYWPPVEYARLGIRGRRTFSEPDPEVAGIIERELERRIGELPGEGEVRLQVWPSIGSLAYPLGRWSKREHADLIAIGHHHRSLLSRLWHGSVAHALLSQSELPVVCVPESTPVAEEQGLEVPHYERALIAVDVDDTAGPTLAHGFGLVARGGSVDVLHVIEGPVREPAESDLDEEMRARIEERFEHLLPRASDREDLEVRFHIVEGGDPGEEIVAAAHRLGAHVVVVGSHGRRGLKRAIVGSVAESVLRHTDRPVMVVQS